ncbi:hypothetical protein N7526_007638 [Penicillium atrosanguineum]|nr:hypothetical protein N7526_007638 [Penicillium atrosanguineum]
MNPYKGSDFQDGPKSRSRTSSISSDSQLSRVNLMSPPRYDHRLEFNAADFVADDEEPGSGANALVTPAALSLLNNFLDNLLFNILAASKSTQLTAIRPCLADVLKPRLAGEVVATADEELSEYMGGAEDEQTEFRGGQQPGGDFDLVRSWKLTRLRCMVYTRLGNMEEEDEDEFIAQEGLRESDGAPRRFSSHVDNITPAAAIFLTSIIEHIGEQALIIAGRLRAPDLEDLDMEKLALNATLGRLWRTWRKRRRGTTVSRSLSRAGSRDSFRRRTYSLANSRKSSIVTIEEPVTPKEHLPEEIPAPVNPADVPLPIGDYDVQEIEVPGYSHDLDGEVQTMEAVVAHKVRPRSLMVFPSPSLAPRSPGSKNQSPVSASAIENPKSLRHSRSRSLPNAAGGAREVQESAEGEQPSPTSSEKAGILDTMYEDDESAEFVDAAESALGLAITTPSEELVLVDESAEKDRMSILHEEEEEAAPPVNEMVASLRSVTPDEVINQVNSSRASISSPNERTAKEPEVIEGQGMCEKPRPASTIQRPRRHSSRDAVQPNAKAIDAETSYVEKQPAVESPPPTQGMEIAPTPSAATVEAIEIPNDNEDAIDDDQDKSVMSFTPATEPSIENVVPETTNEPSYSPEHPRPSSTSGSSEYSSRSRKARPTPLIVAVSSRSPTGSERAAVQRMPTRPSTSVQLAQPKPRRSESFSSSKEKRPVTAGSTTSGVSTKLKGIMGRQPGDSPSLRLRSSSDTSRASGSGDSVENDTSADLDKLINSDETIHYTLTPRSVREMSFPDAPRPIPRSDTQDTHALADFIKNTGPPVDEPPQPHKARASVSSKATGELTSLGRIRSNLDSPRTIAPPISPISPMSPRATPSPKPSVAGQARDARPSPNSTQEFAEFIKSTGPASPSGSTFTSSPPPSVIYQQGTNFSGTKTSRPGSTLSSSTKSTSRSNGSRPKEPSGSRSKPGPAESKRSATSELIDFIREGPQQPGAHRIPRTVAPFRNTVDSDDMQFDSAQQKGSSVAATQDTSTRNKSLTSPGSRTGPLDSPQRGPSQVRAIPSASSAIPDDDPRPIRKQNRVRDPYAIPDSDDEEDNELLEELISSKPPPRQEESLIDFLRSEPPPDFSQPAPQPLNISTQSQQPGSNGFASSASDLKARFLRGNADRGPSNKMSLSSLRSQNNNGQSPSNYTAKVGMERNPGIMPSTSHKQTETGALADFLRNTGPPEPPPNMNPKTKEGSFSRFFTRRRKIEA